MPACQYPFFIGLYPFRGEGMAWCFHPSPCQGPAIKGETDDGAQGFNSWIAGAWQRTLLPPAPSQDPAPAPRDTSVWPALGGGSRRGPGTLHIHGAASKITGSNWRMFAGQIEPGAVLEMGVAGGSKGGTSWAWKTTSFP